MPLYEYQCVECKKIDSHFESIENRDSHKICQYCGKSVVRIFSVANILHGNNSSNRVSDWWRHEDTPEANREHTKQCFKSLEQKGKLKMPDHKKGGVPVGQNQDWKEFADRV